MMRTRRRTTLAVVISLLLTSWIPLRLWLRAKPLRQGALAAIAEYYDGYAEFDSISFRFTGGVVLNGLRLHEDSSCDSPILCEVGKVELHGSLWGLLNGSFQPTEITLRNLSARVAQSPDGQWLLHLPLRLPDVAEPARFLPVHIQDACLEIIAGEQEEKLRDRRTKRLSGIYLDLLEGSDQRSINLDGRLENRLWGKWRFAGSFSRDHSQLHLRVRSASLTVQQEHAEWLGPAWTECWARLQPAGEIAVDADIQIDPSSASRIEYQVLIDPLNVTLRIPGVPARLRHVAGRIEVTSKEIRLQSLVGRLMGGEVAASGLLAFDPPAFNLAIDVRRISLDQVLGSPLVEAAPYREFYGVLRLRGLPAPETWSGQFDGSLRAEEGRATSHTSLRATIQDGFVCVDDFESPCGDGQVKIQLHVPLHENRLMEGTAKLTQVDLAALWEKLGDANARVSGSVDGDLEFAVPVRSWSDISMWHWTGPVRLRNACFGEFSFSSLEGKATFRDRSLVLSEASATLNGRPLHGQVKFDLTAPSAITGSFTVEPIDLAQFNSPQQRGNEWSRISGELEANGKLSGTCNPPALNLEGTATIRDLRLADHALGNPTLRYVLAGDGFDFDGSEISAFGGTVRGRGRWSWGQATLPPTRAGNPGQPASDNPCEHLRLQGTFENIDASALLSSSVSGAMDVQGRLNGRFTFEQTLGAPGGEQSSRLAGHVHSARLRLGGVQLEKAAADFSAAGEDFNLTSWSAAVPAGQLTGSAKLQRDSQGPVVRVQVSCPDLDFAKLGNIPSEKPVALPIEGHAVAAGDLLIDLDTGSVRGTGTAQCRAVTVNGFPPIESLAGQLEIQDKLVVLRDFQASLWGGFTTGTLRVDLTNPATPQLHVVLAQVRGVQLVMATEQWPALKGKVRGTLFGHGEFSAAGDTSGGVTSASGEFAIRFAQVFGMPVSLAEGSVRLGDKPAVRLAANSSPPSSLGRTDKPVQSRATVQFRQVQVAQGTGHGQVVLSWAQPVGYDARFHFDGLDLATVARSAFASPHPVAGTLGGTVHLHGTGHSAKDVQGDMELKLRDAHLWPFPVFAVIAKVLNLNFSKSGAFRQGQGKATVHNGTITFDEFWLTGDALKLVGQGTVNTDGQIKIEVVANVEAPLLKNVPVLGTFQKALGYLQHRLVKIHLTGTLDDPNAIPVPLQDLSEPALRFFKEVLDRARSDSPEPKSRPMSRPIQQSQELPHPERVVSPRP
ncbi:MAG: hypothetical protein HY000_28790 [Planctomycetes bacterium]|nr:hypothetical protein [Planctomycetota bacterium]